MRKSYNVRVSAHGNSNAYVIGGISSKEDACAIAAKLVLGGRRAEVVVHTPGTFGVEWKTEGYPHENVQE